MAEKITYLFGAGASAQAVPTVEGFKARINLFCDYIGYLAKDHRFLTQKISDFYTREYDWLIEGIDNYTSPDYFAKFLGETSNDTANKIKLIRLKLLLSLFLICEQSPKIQFKEFIFRKYGPSKPTSSSSITNSIDPRYRVFWQDVFEEASTRKLPSNINILTWNYDSQLELSFMEFTGNSLSETNKELQIIPNINASTISPHKLAIIKLNGTAGVFYKREDNQIKDGISYFNANDMGWLEIFDVFQNQIINAHQLLEHPNFYFSWENETHPKRARKSAKEILNKTDKLVVIGYSFPDYNEKIDKDLLYNAVNISEVVIQARNDDKVGILKRFKKRFDNPDTEIDFESSLDRFYMH